MSQQRTDQGRMPAPSPRGRVLVRGASRMRARTLHRTAGFSLIEVLIAVLVLGFGLLGFALMQTLNLRYTQSAASRTHATNLAYDLIDQMRANRLVAAQYPPAATFAAGSITPVACGRPVGPITVALNVGRWQCQVVGALGGDAGANVVFAPGGVVTVTLIWGERLATDPNTTFVVQSQI